MTKATKNAGFTLVEILVVIAIIGILIGILIPAVGAARNRVNEFAIQVDVTNIEAALEQFKTKFEFYPPDMSEINSAADFRPYLEKISRGHSEGDGSAGTGLQIWWDEVGVNLSAETALMFWLSGLADNAQYPLTVADPDSPGDRIAIPAFNVNPIGSGGTPVTGVERKVYLEFKAGQIRTVDGTTQADMMAIYNQPRGAELRPILYFSASAYDTWVNTPSSPPWTVNATFTTIDGNTVTPYFDSVASAFPVGSENTFQIITAGIDGDYGVTGDVQAAGNRDRDNVCSFAEGRLQRLMQK